MNKKEPDFWKIIGIPFTYAKGRTKSNEISELEKEESKKEYKKWKESKEFLEYLVGSPVDLYNLKDLKDCLHVVESYGEDLSESGYYVLICISPRYFGFETGAYPEEEACWFEFSTKTYKYKKIEKPKILKNDCF